MALPPFILSGANSRAHYRLLSRLDASESLQAADAVIAAEVVRCRGVLEGKASDSKTAETLIILLTCTTASTVSLDTDFALVPALKLAEGGKAHRRTGYRFLVERLPKGHELALMLINTVRKDLASSSPSHILMALGVICHLPSDELAPAVLPLLGERRLIEHELPVIRQRTIQALRALKGKMGLRELARRIRKEDDHSVLSSVVKTFGETLDDGAREENSEKRRRQFDRFFAAAVRHLEPSPLLMQFMRTTVCVVATLCNSDDLTAHVLEHAHALTDEIVEVTTAPGPWAQACLVEVCALAAAVWANDGKPVSEPLLEYVRDLLLPKKEKGKERTPIHSAQSSPRRQHRKSPKSDPNARLVALRCLAALPPVWQDGLTEAHMAALMAGVDSSDRTVRVETLRLLARVDADLPRMTANSHLDTLSRGEEGKEDAAERALEAFAIALEREDPVARGQGLAKSLAQISPHFKHVWMKGVHAAIEYTEILLPASFIDSAAEALLAAPADPTLTVAVATLAAEHDRPAVPALLAALPDVDAEVQELCILALVPLHGGQEAVRTLRKVAEGAIPHIRRRCEQVALVLEQGRAWDVVGRAKSRALTDVLDALLAVHAELVAPSRPSLEERDSTPTASVIRPGPPALKYNYGPGSPLGRAAELAMGRSTLVEPDDVALDELAADTGQVRI